MIKEIQIKKKYHGHNDCGGEMEYFDVTGRVDVLARCTKCFAQSFLKREITSHFIPEKVKIDTFVKKGIREINAIVSSFSAFLERNKLEK